MTIPVTEQEWPEYLAVQHIFQTVVTQYDLWKELFFDEETVACIKGSGTQFISTIYDALHKSVVIQLAALHDKNGKADNANITFGSLVSQVKNWLPPSCIAELAKYVEQIDAQLPELRRYRNKALAHKDKKTTMSSSHKLFLKHSIIDGVIHSTDEALGIISTSLFSVKYAYKYTPRPSETFTQVSKNWLWTLQLQSLVKANQFNKEEIVDLVLYRWDSRVWIDFAKKNQIESNVFISGKIYNPFLHGNQ